VPIPIPSASASLRFPYGETVTIRTPAVEADPYSSEPGTPAEDIDVDGVAVEPRPSSEPVQDARNSVVSGFTLYFPAGTPVSAAQQVIVRGDVYDVLGQPAEWRNPFTGWDPGVVVQVGRTEG